MSAVGRSMAKGAAWMVLFRVFERSIGVLSTLILARLLIPADFGLIAMAMSFVAILELLWTFTFDNALIQNATAGRSHYDTAWTLNVCLGLIIAAGLAAVSYPAAWFYEDPRIVPIVLCLAVSALLQGFENIGVVAFRKEMRFGMEFGYQATRKIAGFLVTIPLAFALRNYWALVAGMLTGRVAAVVISYIAHPFRPRFTLANSSDLLGFSKWLFVNNVLFAIQMRSQDFVIGKTSGATGLGLYNVSYEISTLPSTELVAPINRAVFPGFAKVANDPPAITRGYLRVLGMIGLVTLPAGLGIAAVADLLIPTVLGANWLQAVPIVKILAVYGALAAMGSVFSPTFMALGRPRMLLVFTALNVALFVPTVIYGAVTRGVIGAAWGCLLVVTVMLPVSHFIACRALNLPVRIVIAEVWRPALAAAVMYGSVTQLVQSMAPEVDSLILLPQLLASVLVGVLVYALTLLGLWLLAGRPVGGESIILDEIRNRWRRRSA